MALRFAMLLLAVIEPAAPSAPVWRVQDVLPREAYCDRQNTVCLSLCAQVTQGATNKRVSCDGSCDRSTNACYINGRFNFAPLQRYLPEFDRD